MTFPLIFKVGKPTSAAYDDREYLEVQLRQPEQWFYYAERHRRIAMLILDRMERDEKEAEEALAMFSRRQRPLDLYNQALMEMGLAIENLAKGARIPSVDPLITTRGELNRTLKRHDLAALVEDLNLSPPRPEWVDFLKVCTVMVSGPDARYPTRARINGESMIGANYSLVETWRLFEQIFETLALELLQRTHSQVRITLNCYDRSQQDLCIQPCSHEEWIAWRLHDEFPEWLVVPPTPEETKRELQALLARGRGVEE